MCKYPTPTFVIVIMLLVVTLSLGGCKRQDSTATATPAVKQFIPAVGSDTSPLPTAGAADSPVQP